MYLAWWPLECFLADVVVVIGGTDDMYLGKG